MTYWMARPVLNRMRAPKARCIRPGEPDAIAFPHRSSRFARRHSGAGLWRVGGARRNGRGGDAEGHSDRGRRAWAEFARPDDARRQRTVATCRLADLRPPRHARQKDATGWQGLVRLPEART